MAEAFNVKHVYGQKPEYDARPGAFEFTAVVVLAWQMLLKDATRWRFD